MNWLDIRKINELFECGTEAQFSKLLINRHKKDFDQATPEYCIRRIHEELVELEEAHTLEEKRLEAADIANFCHMLILHCDRILANTEKSVKKSGDV